MSMAITDAFSLNNNVTDRRRTFVTKNILPSPPRRHARSDQEVAAALAEEKENRKSRRIQRAAERCGYRDRRAYGAQLALSEDIDIVDIDLRLNDSDQDCPCQDRYFGEPDVPPMVMAFAAAGHGVIDLLDADGDEDDPTIEELGDFISIFDPDDTGVVFSWTPHGIHCETFATA